MPDIDLTTLVDVKSFLSISGSNYDTLLGSLITSVSRFIEKYCDRIFTLNVSDVAQDTNYLSAPEALDDTSFWTPAAATITPNVLVHPLSGLTTIDAFTETAAIALHDIRQVPMFPNNINPINRDVIAEAILKAGLRDLIIVSADDGTGGIIFNLTTLTIQAVGNYTGQIANLGGGFYRCTATKSNNTSAPVFRLRATKPTETFYAGDNSAPAFYAGSCLLTFTETVSSDDEEIYDGGNRVLFLKRFPINHIASISYRSGSFDNPTWINLNPASDFEVNQRTGEIRFSFNLPCGFQNVRVLYAGGYISTMDLPLDLQLAAKRMVAKEFLRRKSQGALSEGISDASVSWNEKLDPGVKNLIDPFIRFS